MRWRAVVGGYARLCRGAVGGAAVGRVACIPPFGMVVGWWRFAEKKSESEAYGRTRLRIYTVRVRARWWCGRLRAFFERSVAWC